MQGRAYLTHTYSYLPNIQYTAWDKPPLRDIEVDKRLKPNTTPIFCPHLIRENKFPLSKCLKMIILRAKGQLWKILKCPDTIGYAISHSKGLRTYTLLFKELLTTVTMIYRVSRNVNILGLKRLLYRITAPRQRNIKCFLSYLKRYYKKIWGRDTFISIPALHKTTKVRKTTKSFKWTIINTSLCHAIINLTLGLSIPNLFSI